MLLNWLRRVFAAWRHEMSEPEAYAAIRALPLESARSDALRQLRDVNQFEVESATTGLTHEMPPTVRDLFSQYTNILGGGDLELDRKYLPIRYLPGEMTDPVPDEFILVGTDIEHAFIGVHRTTEELVCLEEREYGWSIYDSWPSLWHFILSKCALLYDYHPASRATMIVNDHDGAGVAPE